MSLGEKLHDLRKKKGLSQEEIGDLLNVSRQTISKWETNQSYPEFDKLVPLSKLYNISIDELANNNQVKTDNIVYVQVKHHYEYKSKAKIFGLPLIHINIGKGFFKAKGIIAIGNIALGIIPMGFLSLGILSFGLLSLGLLAIGSIALGLLAIGGIAIGLLAIGGIAIGVYSVGGLSIASKIALGGYAKGDIAIGEYVSGKITFVTNNSFKSINSNELKIAILKEFPKTWKLIVDIFCTIVK